MTRTLPILIVAGFLTSGCAILSGGDLKAPCNARPAASLDGDPCHREPVNTAMTGPANREGAAS